MAASVSQDFDQLVGKGVYGFYDFCQVTSVFLYSGPILRNYYTIVVFDEYGDVPIPYGTEYLTRSMVKLNRQYKLGICRFYLPVSEARVAFESLNSAGRWKHGNGELMMTTTPRALRKQFVPSTSLLHSLLKEDHGNGSYVIELFDEKKDVLQDLSESDRVKVSQEVIEHVPIHLNAAKERIGNVVFQFPSKLIACNMYSLSDWTGITVDLAWDRRLMANPKTFTIETATIVDDVILGHHTTNIRSVKPTSIELKSGNSDSLTRLIVLGEDGDLIFHASSGTFIRTFDIQLDTGMQNSEPRTVKSEYGQLNEISLVTPNPITVGPRSENAATPYYQQILKSRQENEVLELTTRGDFRQFQPGPGQNHEAALQHIRNLIGKYANSEIYLWDPYLDYRGVLDAAYYYPRLSTSIRVITSYRPSGSLRKARTIVHKGLFLRRKSSRASYLHFRKIQRQGFRRDSNNLGIQIEVRCRHGNAGWRFHDRFLILPHARPADSTRAWSLGTSVNSVGKAGHHVIQEVPNPELIYAAFSDLWEALDDPTCLVWRYPNE